MTPTPIEDTYTFTIEADFTAWVPVPVITVEPSLIDLERIRLLGSTNVVFNISTCFFTRPSVSETDLTLYSQPITVW